VSIWHIKCPDCSASDVEYMGRIVKRMTMPNPTRGRQNVMNHIAKRPNMSPMDKGLAVLGSYLGDSITWIVISTIGFFKSKHKYRCLSCENEWYL